MTMNDVRSTVTTCGTETNRDNATTSTVGRRTSNESNRNTRATRSTHHPVSGETHMLSAAAAAATATSIERPSAQCVHVRKFFFFVRRPRVSPTTDNIFGFFFFINLLLQLISYKYAIQYYYYGTRTDFVLFTAPTMQFMFLLLEK